MEAGIDGGGGGGGGGVRIEIRWLGGVLAGKLKCHHVVKGQQMSKKVMEKNK